MKIDRSYTPPATVASPPASTRASVPAPRQENPSEEVTLSDAARLAAAESEAPLDLARIAEIKQAIAENRFKINASAIADRLIESTKSFLDKKPQA